VAGEANSFIKIILETLHAITRSSQFTKKKKKGSLEKGNKHWGRLKRKTLWRGGGKGEGLSLRGKQTIC